MFRRWIVPAVLAATACGGGDDRKFSSPEAIAQALGCEYRAFTSVVGPGTAQGGCDYAGASMSLTTTSISGQAARLADVVAKEQVTVLVGANWLVVSRDAAAVAEARDVLGGVLR